MEEGVRCNECDWTGDLSELVSTTDAMDDPCNKCPNCGSDDIEDIDDE